MNTSTDELTALDEAALKPPRLYTSPLPEYDYDRLDYGMTIGIDRTPGGRLWVCWVGGGDNEDAFFVLATSDDDGQTWPKPRLVVDPHETALPLARRSLVGNLWTDPAGKLWLFFDQSFGKFDGRAGSWYTTCDNPDAEHPVWSEPVRNWHGCSLNKPLVLSTGEWLLPVSLWDRGKIHPLLFQDAYHELDQWRGANVLASSDQGRTWTRRSGVLFPHPDFDEPMFMERNDGSIWMTARTGKGIWESVSEDGGHTWSTPTPSAIVHVPSRHFMRRLQSGRILLVKHGLKTDERPSGEPYRSERSFLTAFLSEDDGQSWQGGLLLDERTNVSYPDGFQSPDGTITISYDWERDREGNVLMARFTEEDILAGKLVSPNSVLKHLICRPLKHD
jgi:sialidase-1